MKQPILTKYVSEIDKLLQEFDKKNPEPTKSQRNEIVKHNRIHALRDSVHRNEEPKKHWEGF